MDGAGPQGQGAAGASAGAASAASVAAPMAGTLHAWKVADGETVAAGQLIAIMEAMKMEMQVTAHRAGVLHQQVTAGSAVAAGTVLASID